MNWIQGRDVYVPFPTERPDQRIVEEQQADEDESDASPKGKTLQDLMKESGSFDDEDDDDWLLDEDEDENAEKNAKPKSLKELMNESGAFDDDDDDWMDD